MTKIKFLYIIIVILVAANIGLVSFMYFHKPPHPMHGEGPKKEITEKLNFSPEQAAKYEVIIKEHRASIDKIESEIKVSKNHLFALLKFDIIEKRDSIIGHLGMLQTEIEMAHYNHFEKLKALCTAEQMPKFDNLTKELGRLFAPPHPPKR